MNVPRLNFVEIGTLIPTAALVRAELPWYEAHGVGRKKLKINRLLG